MDVLNQEKNQKGIKMNLTRISKVLEKNPELFIRSIILRRADKGQVVYGARATNAQLPMHLRKETSDYDILTHKPKKNAVAMAKKLNKAIGSKRYIVIKAKHSGTYKIKTKEGKTIVDYTQLKRKPKTKKIYGTEYKDIKAIKKNVKRLIKKPETKYRRQKDIGTLSRIKEIERIENLF